MSTDEVHLLFMLKFHRWTSFEQSHYRTCNYLVFRMVLNFVYVTNPSTLRSIFSPCNQIKKRGAPPAGGGEIQFLCPIVRQVKTLNFVEPGKIKRIRGIALVFRLFEDIFQLTRRSSDQTCCASESSIFQSNDRSVSFCSQSLHPRHIPLLRRL
jgi:hypothetical protein